MDTLLYPIRAVAKQTGLSIDTLRAWERRYQAIMPQRGGRGRLFTEADIQRLHLLRMAIERGHTIGQLASLSDEELQGLLTNAVLVAPDVRLTKAMRRNKLTIELEPIRAAIELLDYAEAERELARLAAILTPREFVHQVAQPLMQQVGAAWHEGKLSIAQEHMTSSLLRNLLGALVPLYRRLSPPGKLLFATPSGELHEFGILIAALLTVGGGLGVIYLGTNLPAEEIVMAAHKTAPQAVVLGLIGANGASAGVKEVELVGQKLHAQIELWVGGIKEPAVDPAIRQTRALVMEDFIMLEQHLVRLGARF